MGLDFKNENKEEQEQQQQQRRIYLVAEGLKSKQTGRSYRCGFQLFLKHIGNPDLQSLIDTKNSVLKSFESHR